MPKYKTTYIVVNVGETIIDAEDAEHAGKKVEDTDLDDLVSNLMTYQTMAIKSVLISPGNGEDASYG